MLGLRFPFSKKLFEKIKENSELMSKIIEIK